MLPPRVVTWFSRNRRWLVLGTVAAFSLFLLGSFTYSMTCGLHGCPSVRQIRAFLPRQRNTIPLARIPDNVQNAFIAVEDRRFAEHHGIDWRAFGRAFVRNTTTLGVREGASTITMQVARSAFIRDDDCSGRSLGRKLVELRLAPRIEAALSKDQILTLYLNLIYLGDGKYGVEAASRHYFGKSVTKLSLAEAAMLAALPRAPSVYDPQEHPDRAVARRNLVLGLMAQEGFITDAQAKTAAEKPLLAAGQRGNPATRTGSARVVQVVNEVKGDGGSRICSAGIR
ncbi:MAG: biosynthetic peptidoglycan transglycosylase [Gemmatimonadota bacterium]